MPRTSIADRRVQAPRLADMVADRIRELIVSGELRDGERLPPLDAMLEEFGVSGPSMREALRMLESEGLISVRRGNVGGAIVHRPTEMTAAYTLALVLRSRATSLGDVAEALTILDPVCATLCARRADRHETVVRELRQVNKTARDLLEGDEMAFIDAMTSFHEIIVRECGNKSLSLLAGALGSVWVVNVREWARTSAAHGAFPTTAERLAALESHEQVTDLIEAGEDHQAAQAMTEHIDMKQVLRSVDPEQLVSTLAGAQH